MALLEIEGLSLASGGEILLADVGFLLAAGEILALLGPSGAGKTTLLRLVAGLERPDSGRIVFDGRDMATTAPHLRSFGMMFQEFALFPHLDVMANVAFGLEMQKVRPEQRRQRVSRILEMVGLGGFAHRSLDSLSGGERQRVALARSLAPEPRLLLLDEPLASLDRTLRDRLADEIRSILKTLGITAIFVTHDQSEAFAVADRIAILAEGRLEQFGSPESVYRRPNSVTVAAFLGFHNLLAATRDDAGRVHSPLGSWQGIHLPDNAEVKGILLIRPDGARLLSSAADAPNGIVVEGLVERRQFQGRSYHLTVSLKGQRLVFDLPLDPRPPTAANLIRLSLNPDTMVWLKTHRRTT